MKSEHLSAAERLAEEAEALASRTKAADKELPFTWGLMYVDTGEVYYSESCVGTEADMREEAICHNENAMDAGEPENRIAAVPLWLREGGTNALTAEVWRCDSCGYLHESNTHVLCNGCMEIQPMTHYRAILQRI